MGQATLADKSAGDLPDPTNSVGSAALASADDLLAQLAGEEIDRLLAESEAEAEADVEALAAADVQALAAAQSQEATEPAPALAPKTESETVGAVLDKVDAPPPAAPEIQTAPQTQTAPNIEVPKPFVAEPAPASPTPPAPEPDQQLEAARATAAEEMNELLAGAPELADLEDDTPPPIYVRLLMTLNAPFDVLPTATREAIGKVAILTLFNSVAVLLYVLMFRRH